MDLYTYEKILGVDRDTAQDIVNKQINKTMNQAPSVSAKAIDDELIKHALDAKKLEVLGRIDEMIKDAKSKPTKSNKKRN